MNCRVTKGEVESGSNTMESRNHSNATSPKSLMSKGNNIVMGGSKE